MNQKNRLFSDSDSANLSIDVKALTRCVDLLGSYKCKIGSVEVNRIAVLLLNPVRFFLSVCLQNGKVLFPAPQPNNIPVAAPPKPKSIQELQKEKAAAVSPFTSTLTTASAYTGGKAQERIGFFLHPSFILLFRLASCRGGPGVMKVCGAFFFFFLKTSPSLWS